MDATEPREPDYQALFEGNPQPTWVYDLETLRFLAVNLAAVERYGYSRQEFLAMRISEIRPPEDLDATLASVATEAPASGVSVSGGCRHRRKDGTLIDVEIHSRPLVFAGRRAELVVPHDVTARNRSEAELARSELHFRSLIENARDVIAVVGRDGKLRYASPSLERVLGYRVSDLLGTDLMALVHPEEVEEARTCLSAEDATKLAPGYRDLRLRHRDGSWRVLAICPSPLPESAGGPGLVLNAHDVTERRQLGEQLRQAAKMEAVGRLAAGVAHDFNNVLTLVIGHAELALMQLGPEDPRRANLREILAAAEHAASLTRQLLTISRKRLIEPEVLDVRAVIGSMSGMLGRVIGEDLELVTAIDPTAGRVRADRANLEQILLNLAVNARDAMRGGGRLTIEVGNVELDERYARQHPEAPSGRYVMLAVTDTGHGMDAETRRRIFEPFFTTKEAGHGTGLGLATVYGIVKQLAGSIQVDSEPGRGATFKVYLPWVEADVLAPTAPDGEEPPRGEGTILLLENDELVRGMARATLERVGYRVLVAGDFAAAERVFAGGEPVDLVIADVMMPRLEEEMARRWASREPAPSLLFMSGYTEDVIERTWLLASGAGFLQKPFTPAALTEKVRQLLAARRSPGSPTVGGARPPLVPRQRRGK